MKVNVYGACDKAIKAMNRSIVEEFGRLKMAKWDEIHIIRTVASVYNNSQKRARKRYYEVAFEGYLLYLMMLGEEPKKAHQMAEKAITEEWIDKILAEVDPLVMYRFDTETERKAYRLAEVLEVSPERNREIDKAMKEWSRQIGQYAINVTDYAGLQALKDYGVKEVEWVTAEDEKVCHACGAMNGIVYDIDEVPVKPHPNCRCTIRPHVR